MTKFRVNIDAIKRYYASSNPGKSPPRRFANEVIELNGHINTEGHLSDWTVEFKDEAGAIAFKLKFGA